MYKKWGKRLLDIVLGSILLAVSLPIIILVGIILFFDTGWPIIFLQKRVGYKGKIVHILKFRTLRGKPCATHLPAEECLRRASPVGRFIRNHKLDEFIQIMQVVLGTLSLVGPRPKVPDYISKQLAHPSELLQVFSVKPGLTGLTQVSLLSADWDKRPKQILQHDLAYVKQLSLYTDLVIMLRTARVIILGK